MFISEKWSELPMNYSKNIIEKNGKKCFEFFNEIY